MRWPGLGEVSPPRGMTASGSSESLLTGLFQPVRMWSPVFWAPLLTVTVPRVCRGRVHGEAAADAAWLPPAASPRHTDVCLPREGRRGSLSPGGAPAEAQTSDRGGRVRAVRWSVCTAGDPDQHGRTSPGSGCDVCGGQSDPVSAPPGSGLHTGSSQRESSRVQSASVLPVSGVRAGGEHPCAPGERARLSVSAPARGFLTARKRPPWAALGPEETRLEAPVF